MFREIDIPILMDLIQFNSQDFLFPARRDGKSLGVLRGHFLFDNHVPFRMLIIRGHTQFHRDSLPFGVGIDIQVRDIPF
jgi:hypothetical protein